MNKIKYVIFFKILITLFLIDSNTSKANSFGLQIFLPHIHLSPESVSFGEKYSLGKKNFDQILSTLELDLLGRFPH